jgi:hypothetical protein
MAVATVENQLDTWIAERAPIQYWALAWLSGESSRTLRGRGIGYLVASMMLPAMGSAADAEAVWQVKHDAVELTFALAEFHAKHGRYPQALAELVPDEMEHLPDDPFAPLSRPMAYLPTSDGYVLFSHDGREPATAPPEPGSHAFSKLLIFRVPWQEQAR